MHARFERRRCCVTAALFLSFLAASCGGAKTSQAAAGARSAGAAQPAEAATTSNTCSLLTDKEIEQTVGNPVLKGQPYMDNATCKWDTEKREDTTVLLMVHRTDSLQAPILCKELRTTGGTGDRVQGLDVGSWKFEDHHFFKTGDFEGCGPKGFLSLQLNGAGNEESLKRATLTLAGKVAQRQ
jgi:hypothetical protein